ncbi:MAG: response regulator transcription factor [Lachnospiraceae bacterium]|nr:response regulator transcription factor [Lachnospiraceae bacterium]
MIEVYYMEDDENIATAVKEYLCRKGYEVFTFRTLESGKKALEHHIPSLALIDWNMPDGRGNNFCRWIRSRWKELPIIFLTVREDTRDIISGFEYGADDYVTKPFELEVLYSRIHALLRRAGNVQGRYLSCGSISIDKNKTAVYCGEEEITVSQSEYQLLQYLMENKGKTVTRERLLTQIWDNNGNYVNDNTLTVTMKRLREKLHHPSCLKTIRSFGYRMEEDGI